jgi:putative ABC transport system ATP-binding protein
LFKLQNIKVRGILNIDELSIPEGMVTCILGPSGSGKSTLLRLLNDLENPDDGEISYNNQSFIDIDPIELRRRVVMVPQIPLIFEGTIEDNLLIGLRFAEKELASPEEMKEALQMVHLHKDLKQNADHLSGGEKQRLALARAILMKPEVFLLDEPSSALDEDTADDVIQSLVQYAKINYMTVVMVTHSKQLAEMVSDNKIDMTRYSIVATDKEG